MTATAQPIVNHWRQAVANWKKSGMSFPKDETLYALRAKYDELPVLRIWQAARYLDVDQSYLRRLKANGVIAAARDTAGHVVYKTSNVAALARSRNERDVARHARYWERHLKHVVPPGNKEEIERITAKLDALIVREQEK